VRRETGKEQWLLAAESNLIAAAGVLELTTRNLARLRELYKTLAVSQKDLEQGISDQQTAESHLRAGRDAVRIFGKSYAEIDKIVAARLADPTLVVSSPIDGRIVARNAAPVAIVIGLPTRASRNQLIYVAYGRRRESRKIVDGGTAVGTKNPHERAGVSYRNGG
jgi:hypothetical protein